LSSTSSVWFAAVSWAFAPPTELMSKS
jgi:hypothetical protein